MMLAAMTIDEIDPPSGEFFKGVVLAGINDVVDDAGNHFDALRWALRISALRITERSARRRAAALYRSPQEGATTLSAFVAPVTRTVGH